MAMGKAHAQARAAPTPPGAARHVGGRPGLVNEDQAFGIEVGLGVEPGAALAQNIRAVLLDGARVVLRGAAGWKGRDQ